MRGLICLLLCLCCYGLNAQELEEDANLELIWEDVPDLIATELYQEQEAHKLAAAASYTDKAWKAQLLQQTGNWQNRGNLLYKKDLLHYKYQLSYDDKLSLGHYRFAWGQGLLFNKAQKQAGFIAPAAAQSYSPLGLGTKVSYHALGLYLGASVQQREAKLKDGYISSLPRMASGLLPQTRESIYFAGLAYEGAKLHFGGSYYQQAYDRAWQPAAGDSLLKLWDSYLQANLGTHQLKAEGIWQKDASYSIAWEMKEPSFSQSWSWRHLGAYQRPAYAAKALRLSNTPHREEIAAEFKYKPLPHLNTELQATLNYPKGLLQAQSWLSEEILKLRYGDSQSRAELQFVSIDRDVLAAVDSLYRDTKDRHQRYICRLFHRVNNELSWRLNLRYQYQERAQKLSQGLWWEQAFSYAVPGFKASLAYSLWNNGKYPLYIKEEDSPEYQRYGSASSAIKLSCQYIYRAWSIEARVQQDLQAMRVNSVYLQVQYKVNE